jgi:hypothetical protein
MECIETKCPESHFTEKLKCLTLITFTYVRVDVFTAVTMKMSSSGI